MWFDVVILTLCTGCCILCVLVARKRPPVPRKEVSDLRIAVAELQDEHEKLHALLAKKTQRQVMRDRRNGDAEGAAQLPGESPMEWKRRVRKLMNQGTLNLKHGA